MVALLPNTIRWMSVMGAYGLPLIKAKKRARARAHSEKYHRAVAIAGLEAKHCGSDFALLSACSSLMDDEGYDLDKGWCCEDPIPNSSNQYLRREAFLDASRNADPTSTMDTIREDENVEPTRSDGNPGHAVLGKRKWADDEPIVANLGVTIGGNSADGIGDGVVATLLPFQCTFSKALKIRRSLDDGAARVFGRLSHLYLLRLRTIGPSMFGGVETNWNEPRT